MSSNTRQGHDDLETVSFTLSNHAKNLTLADIANTLFGARLTSSGAKLTVVVPAAPDAVNDSYNIFEDGQSGLGDPSKISHGIVMQVLANDTDADGNTLTINHVEGALHGTVQIVDGDDADHLVGDAVLYTPDLDYAGKDSFTYCITDNHGGTICDVQVNVEAVRMLRCSHTKYWRAHPSTRSGSLSPRRRTTPTAPSSSIVLRFPGAEGVLVPRWA